MLRADLSAAARNSLPGERNGSTVKPEAADLVRHAGESIRLALSHGTAIGSLGLNGNAATLPRSTNLEQGFDDISRIVDIPKLPAWRPPTTTLHALQEWEGHVVEIGDEEFTARLTDITAGASYEGEEAVIPLADLSDRDAARMEIGSIFRWVIGYERSIAGTKKRVSQIVLRDLPVFTESDLRAGEAWAEETMRSFEL